MGAVLGGTMKEAMEENMKKSQEAMKANQQAMMERQMIVQQMMQQKMMAAQLARQRDLYNWVAAFTGTVACVSLVGFMKTRKPGIFGPLLPLGFLTAYNYDAAHGDKIQRIRDEAESILEHNPALLSLPKGPITFEMVEERRLAQKEGGCVF